MTPDQKPRTFDSLKAAATALKIPLRVIQAAKAAGCSAFRSNRVYEAELLQWMEANPKVIIAAENDPKGELTYEQIRKLRLANDSKQGLLVERAWVASRMQLAASQLNAMRAKWEAEQPLKFAATNGDTVECRTILRGIFDGVFSEIQTLAGNFEEETKL